MTHPTAQVTTSAALDAELKSHTKILLQLLAFGIGALVLGTFGEMSLTRSSPIFAYLGWTYSAWQMSYFFGLTMLTIAWLAALAQRLGIMADCRTQRNLKLRFEADRDARQQRRRATKAAPPEELLAPRRRANARSSKFDY